MGTAHTTGTKVLKRTEVRKAIRPKECSLPDFCDFTCPHAAFAAADTVGACRRELAVRCTLFHNLNLKHSHCLGRPT